ncbi:fumarylacetoacetate hydrolase family protein [Bacillus sp. ISL-40]|uniref:fumarylacetoacetate hydrolase family protein n=1 Tax=unclassified Bacillus (in: firmicutes) TaxID=185979 RepID=UPI001BE7A184|nr:MULTISPECIES: fumarylacetoacetate hydrolase family protein [unclassified Bacillus (in: firmicutes)]MBT2699960.1 fumarylacetoacetate hydrolase family protein [Bacillus sp. ISL-40]MBT2722978.1 fumarylacetoacetate hydrolase family protein [Bacillus sp. ISL-46]MBT2740843.1 fumarylacetoacetate hydrolase family protein [Bacillus sp. ISL-77]
MKLVNYKVSSNDESKFGVKTDAGIVDIVKAWETANEPHKIPLSLEQWLHTDEDSKEIFQHFVNSNKDNSDFLLQENQIEYGPCVPKSAKIICVGLNYRKHAEESKMEPPKTPVLFNKYGNSLAGHGQKVEIPADAKQVDFEAELGIVIGKEAKGVPKESALDYVAGYCNANDLSARDLQFRTNQWLLGKACDGFCPVGPYLVTADEVGDPNRLKIETIVNGKVRQSSNTADMIFYCDEIISYISTYITLEPGDLIITGTPEGVILGLPQHEQDWLTDGDEVTIKIEKLGVLTNQLTFPLVKTEEQKQSVTKQN